QIPASGAGPCATGRGANWGGSGPGVGGSDLRPEVGVEDLLYRPWTGLGKCGQRQAGFDLGQDACRRIPACEQSGNLTLQTWRVLQQDGNLITRMVDTGPPTMAGLALTGLIVPLEQMHHEVF